MFIWMLKIKLVDKHLTFGPSSKGNFFSFFFNGSSHCVIHLVIITVKHVGTKLGNME